MTLAESKTGLESVRTLRLLADWAIVCVPVVLVCLTVLVRSLARANKVFCRENWYLGIDLCFAGLAMDLVGLFDNLKAHLDQPTGVDLSRAFVSLILAISTWVVLLLVTKFHQTWEVDPPRAFYANGKPNSPGQIHNDLNHAKGQRLWLVGISNILGLLTVGVFFWVHHKQWA